MNVISNIMVAVGATLILIGVIGLTVSGARKEGETAAAEGETAEAGTSPVRASGAATFPRGEGFEETMNE